MGVSPVAAVPNVVLVKRAWGWFAAVGLVAVALAPAAGAAAPTPQERQRQIDQELRRLSEEIGEVREHEARLLAELSVTQRHRRDLDLRVAAIDAQIVAAQGELDAAT